MTEASQKWTEKEIHLLREHKGRISELLPKLPNRAYHSIRTKRSKLCISSTHTPWTYDEDTVLRDAPSENMASFFKKNFPRKNYHICYQRYRRYIAPLLGKAQAHEPVKTRFKNHVKLARTEQERNNLIQFFTQRGESISIT
jgi:hypothetical protein